jgi:hypothetical protein
MGVLNFLNENSGAIQAIATFLLVIVTIIYAYFTNCMQKIASKQITSDIIVSDIALESSAEKQKDNLKDFNTPHILSFNLFFDISNRGSGSGSIEKPILVLKIDSLEWKICPKREELVGSNYREQGPMTVTQDFYKDLGGSIYLRGGEYEKIELEYSFDIDENFVESFKNNSDSLKYYIKYKNNFGEEYKREDIEIKYREH